MHHSSSQISVNRKLLTETNTYAEMILSRLVVDDGFFPYIGNLVQNLLLCIFDVSLMDPLHSEQTLNSLFPFQSRGRYYGSNSRAALSRTRRR